MAAAATAASVAVHELRLEPLSSLPKSAGHCEPANMYYGKRRCILMLGKSVTTQCHAFVVSKGGSCQN